MDYLPKTTLILALTLLCLSQMCSSLECYKCDSKAEDEGGEACHDHLLDLEQLKVVTCPEDTNATSNNVPACEKSSTHTYEIREGEKMTYYTTERGCTLVKNDEMDTCDHWSTVAICACRNDDLCNSASALTISIPAAFTSLLILLIFNGIRQ